MKQIWKSITTPPYHYLPVVIWVYVVIANLILHKDGIYTGHLAGFDDQVRMTQVLNWVNGAGWYDRTIMRANPPEGFTTIWSRIVDIPIALVVLFAQQFVSQKIAAMIAAAIVPMIELGILFGVAPYFARPLVGRERARLIILFLMFTSLLNVSYFSASGFLVGQASHHPWYTILNLSMFGAAARIAMGSFYRSPIVILGGSVALLTAVGIEGYPMIAGATCLLALTAWGWNRPSVAACGGDALILGAIGSLILLPMHQPPSHFFTASFAEPSIIGPLLVGIAGLFLKAEQFVVRQTPTKPMQAVILCMIAAVTAVALVSFFPQMLDGAAAGLSPAERKMALSEHYEALSIYAVSRGPWEVISNLAPIFIGLAAGIFAFRRSHGRRRVVAFCYLGFAVLGGGMSGLFSRYYHHAMTTCCAWLLWAWEYIKFNLRKNAQYGLRAATAFIALGPLWMLLLPMAEKDMPFGSHVLLFPAIMEVVQDPCDSLPLANYVNAHYQKNTLLLVPYWLSAQFLYQTDTRLDFIANYPSHDKFIDNYQFFGTRNADEAHTIVTRHGVDLIAICRVPYLYRDGVPDVAQTFISRLQAGKPPAWLTPVQTGLGDAYILYAVDKSAPAKETK